MFTFYYDCVMEKVISPKDRFEFGWGNNVVFARSAREWEIFAIPMRM